MIKQLFIRLGPDLKIERQVQLIFECTKVIKYFRVGTYVSFMKKYENLVTLAAYS